MMVELDLVSHIYILLYSALVFDDVHFIKKTMVSSEIRLTRNQHHAFDLGYIWWSIPNI